jgi:hypothetical protein
MSMNVIEIRHYSAARGFLEALRRSHAEWESDSYSDAAWIYRGQRDAEWPLIPSALRPYGPESVMGRFQALLARDYRSTDWLRWCRPAVPKPAYVKQEVWTERVRETALIALTHAMIVREFGVLADQAKHLARVPDFLLHLFNRDTNNRFHRFFNGEEMDPLFAIAQHHGIPTGLLDWSYNPLVAAYFAAAEVLRQPSGLAEDGRIAVWALSGAVLDLDVHLRRLTVPARLTPYLDAQEGLFTWCPQAYLRRIDNGRFDTFDELIVATASYHWSGTRLLLPVLKKLTLPQSEAKTLVRLLWLEKISPAFLMPTFDHVASSLTLSTNWLLDGRVGGSA